MPVARSIKGALKVMVAMALLGVLGVTALFALLWLDHNRETMLPVPTGPFAVGRTTYVWSDNSRTVPPAPQSGTKHELAVWVWYPAETPQSSRPIDDYLPKPWRAAVERQQGIVRVLTRDLSRVRAHSIRDAAISSSRLAYPIVLMRGGAAALVTDYTSLAEDLASHGYIVVGFDVPYRSFVVVFPDGSVIVRPRRTTSTLSVDLAWNISLRN